MRVKDQTLKKIRTLKFLPWAICRNVLDDSCCIKFGEFSRGFSWRIFLGTFSHKNEEKNPARKSAKKSGGSKIKIREKSVLPKAGPKSFQGVAKYVCAGDSPIAPQGPCHINNAMLWPYMNSLRWWRKNHYDGSSKTLRHGLWNALFSWGKFTGDLHRNCELLRRSWINTS